MILHRLRVICLRTLELFVLIYIKCSKCQTIRLTQLLQQEIELPGDINRGLYSCNKTAPTNKKIHFLRV